MKILMTTDTAGGVWHYSMDLTSCLLEEQIKVVLLAMGPKPDKAQQAQVDSLNGLSFYHLPCKLEWMEDPWDEVDAAGDWIRKIYKDEKPDLIHFNNYAHVALGWDSPVLLVAHSCVASWWQAVKQEHIPERFDRYINTVRTAFHTADMVVSPTASMLKVYEQLYGTIAKAEVIYNGISVAEIKAKKKPIIFSMGRLWDEAKNISLILQAAKQIKGKIFIAGNKKNNVPAPGNVTFLGQLSRQEIFDWLNISAVYVLPVKYEPFGLSFLEAASHRCALVGGDIPTMKELWKDSMTYTPTGNSRELAKICNKHLGDEKFCQNMGLKAYQNSKKISLGEKKNQYIKLYSSMQETAFNHNYNKNIYL